ncbi:unnamed protein product [Effrenium voratum]|uniref:Uncharacterized protein n=1 Tax=Effrenium voratum TaxID=2562239 RepID=A0AA36J4R8_9DINO|nr:unnamed protein product [Effrenium voratum]CAJ1413522.1 unnamed protein product [Effrenium voratum]
MAVRRHALAAALLLIAVSQQGCEDIYRLTCVWHSDLNIKGCSYYGFRHCVEWCTYCVTPSGPDECNQMKCAAYCAAKESDQACIQNFKALCNIALEENFLVNNTQFTQYTCDVNCNSSGRSGPNWLLLLGLFGVFGMGNLPTPTLPKRGGLVALVVAGLGAAVMLQGCNCDPLPQMDWRPDGNTFNERTGRVIDGIWRGNPTWSWSPELEAEDYQCVTMSNGVCVVWTAHEWNCREHDFGVCKCYELSSSGKFCAKWSCYSLEADQEICEMRHTDDGEQVSCWYSPFDMNWNSYNQLMERQNSGGLTTGEQIWWGYNWFVRRLAEESAEMEEKELDQYLDYLRKFNSSQMHEELARAGLPHDVTARQLQVYIWPPVYAYSPVARHQFFYWNDVCIVNGDNLVIARRTCPRWREIETEVSSCWCRKESFDAGACAEWLCEERDVGLFSVLFRTKQSIDQWTVGVEFESYQCTGYTINGHCQSWQGQIESVEEVEWSRCTCPPQGCQNDGAVWLCDEWELPKTRDLFFESHLGGLFGFIFAEIFLCCFFGRSAGDDEGDALFAATFCSCLGGLCLMPFLILTYGFYGFLFAGLPFWLLRILFMCCIVAMNFKMPSMERPSNAVRLKRGASKIIGRGRSVTPDDVAVKDVEIVESNETNNQTNNQTNETIS